MSCRRAAITRYHYPTCTANRQDSRSVSSVDNTWKVGWEWFVPGLS
jgi:hypothetical protein